MYEEKYFPDVQEENFILMEQDANSDTSLLFLFAFVRKTSFGMPYILVYVWDSMLYNEGYARFVIYEDCTFTKETEEHFLGYVRDKTAVVNWSNMLDLYEAVIRYFPQWHYRKYAIHEGGMALEHIYYASHRSGAKEILYKANLYHIAYWLDQIPGHDLNGSTPESIVGNHLPVRLLRILDQEGLTERLFSETKMKECREIYRVYSGYMNGRIANRIQWMYLEKVSRRGEFAEQGFNRTLYDLLSLEEHEYVLDVYEEYLKLRKTYSVLQKVKFTKIKDIVDIVNLIQGREYEDQLEEELIKMRKECDDLEFTTDKYSILLPASAVDFCVEAVYQGNCVLDYIYDHMNEESTILFLRQNDSLEIPFVTMEVLGDKVMQLYARYNQLPNKDVYECVSLYARKMGFDYSPIELISEKVHEENGEIKDKHSRELMEYAKEYKRRSDLITVLEGLGLENFEELIEEDVLSNALLSDDES